MKIIAIAPWGDTYTEQDLEDGRVPLEARFISEDENVDEHYSLTELGELMLELAHTEGLDLDTALDRAVAQVDELAHDYPYLWDSTAFSAGNWDAMVGAIPF